MPSLKIHHLSPLKFYWVFPGVLIVYAVCGSPNTPGLAWWALLAALACGLPLAAARYQAWSFVSIWALLHALYFPFAVWLNLITREPGVNKMDLWEATPWAMLAVTVGMAALACGSKLTDLLRPPGAASRVSDSVPTRAEKEILAVPAARNLCLVLLMIPLALMQLATNTYYQGLAAGALEWSEESALSYGYVGYLEYVACVGIFLQLRRYFITRSRQDLIYATTAVLLPVLVYLPSGSRDKTLRDSVYPLFVALLGFKRNFSRKFYPYLAVVIVGILVSMVTIENYRGTIFYKLGKPDLTFNERSGILLNAAADSFKLMERDFDSVLRLWAFRFADYVVVGRIVMAFPEEYPYRWFEDLEYWPIYLLPNPIRPQTPHFDPRDSAALSARVGVDPGGGGSSPAMVIGDLFSRFSWLGVFLGMTLVGGLLRCLDQRLRRFGLFETLLYGLLLVPLAKLPHDSLLAVFLFLTRNLLIALVLAVIPESLLVKKVGRGSLGWRRWSGEMAGR